MLSSDAPYITFPCHDVSYIIFEYLLAAFSAFNRGVEFSIYELECVTYRTYAEIITFTIFKC